MEKLTTYKDRRAFGDLYINEARQILADKFCTSIDRVTVASDALDCKEATDFLVNENIRVGYRCRNASYLSQYPNDITIRLERKSGLSEWQKIQGERVAYMLYGFVDAEGLRRWKLIDLAALLGCLHWSWGAEWELSPARHAPEGQEPFMSIDLSPLDLNRCARAAIIVAEG